MRSEKQIERRIFPVILCGGSGSRLWPLSRAAYPKQFVKLFGNANEQSLFQKTVQRFSSSAFEAPVVLAHEMFRFIARDQLTKAGIEPDRMIIEPSRRNTAPAIFAAALYLLDKDPDAMMLVAPSDHVIPDAEVFADFVRTASREAPDDAMVTFGITPTCPETGYGYLELGKRAEDRMLVPLTAFVEKPDEKNAKMMLESGNYLWNAGIFLMRAETAVAAFRKWVPDLCEAVGKALENSAEDLHFLRLQQEAYDKATDISIDYAIMEKADNLFAAPCGFLWNDMGAWDAVAQAYDVDEQGNASAGPVTMLDCEGSFLFSNSEKLDLVGIGLKDVVVVALNDAVLVADKFQAQRVKNAVEEMKAKQRPAATQFPRDYRPWGWYESVATGDRFQVKRIVVDPGGSLSLQSHFHRAEHWIVVEGTAKVTIDDAVKLVSENQSVFIPVGSVHRLENPGKLPVVLIEVQTGAYLGEDDIVRYEDKYARNT